MLAPSAGDPSTSLGMTRGTLRPVTRFARAISILGHPFVTGTVLITAGTGLAAGLAFLLIAVLPMTVLMFLQVRRGRWEHVDASNKGERRALYTIGLLIALAWLGYLIAFRGASAMPKLAMLAIAMLLVCAGVTRWLKVSLHLFFATLTAAALAMAGIAAGWVVAALVPLLAWSRLHLRRHTAAEVVVGGVMGGLTGLAMHFV
jgi:hypothetical protein